MDGDAERPHGLIRIRLALTNVENRTDEELSDHALEFADALTLRAIEARMAPLSAPTLEFQTKGDDLIVTFELDCAPPDGWTEDDQAALTAHLRGLVG